MNTQPIENLFADRDSTIARDLKMNLKRLADDSALSPSDYGFILLSLANLRANDPMKEAALAIIRENDDGSATDEAIREAMESPAIMNMLNAYYKFRRFLRDADSKADETYGAAKLRMQSLAQPKLGHERFEMLALAISIANGCEQCVTSHVEALKKLGVSTEKIHDIARLTATALGTMA